MENVAQYSNSLVYPSTSTSTARTHEDDDHTVNASSAWMSAQRSVSNTSTSSSQLSSIYSAVDRPANHADYVSPPTSASYGQVQSNDSYSPYPQASAIRAEHDGNQSASISLTSQIPSSIGPARLTRRQTRAQSSTLQLGLRRERPSASSSTQSDLHAADEVRHKPCFPSLTQPLIASCISLLTTCHPGALSRVLRHLPAVATQIVINYLTECLSQWVRALCPCNHLATCTLLCQGRHIPRFPFITRIHVRGHRTLHLIPAQLPLR